MQQEPHGVPGQLNVLVLDVDSVVTRYGRHNRIITMMDVETHEIYLREDHKGLPAATARERIWVASHPTQRLHPRNTKLDWLRSEHADDGSSSWHIYKITPIRRSH